MCVVEMKKLFIPTFDWSINEAKKRYKNSKTHKVNKIKFVDCIKALKSIKDESIDLIIADPPFGIGFSGKTKDQRCYARKDIKVADGYKEVPKNEYASFSDAWISKIYRILKETGSAWIISGWTNLRHIENALAKTGFITVNHIIWHYNFSLPTKLKFSSSHYHILLVCKNEKKRFFNKIEPYPLDVWMINRTFLPDKIKNATKLPIALVQKMIDFASKPGDLVFDPFMGNGTTAQAAKASFRHYLGFEINEQTKEIIERNIKNISLGELYTSYYERINGNINQTKIERFFP